MSKITMDNLSESLINKLKVDLSGVVEVIDKIDGVVQEIDSMLKDEHVLKNDLVTALNNINCDVSGENTIGELFVVIENLKINKGNAMESDVLENKIITDKDGNVVEGTIPHINMEDIEIIPSNEDIILPYGFYPEVYNVINDENLIAMNIKKDVVIFGINGSAYEKN
jgi:hypothetical protein